MAKSRALYINNCIIHIINDIKEPSPTTLIFCLAKYLPPTNCGMSWHIHGGRLRAVRRSLGQCSGRYTRSSRQHFPSKIGPAAHSTLPQSSKRVTAADNSPPRTCIRRPQSCTSSFPEVQQTCHLQSESVNQVCSIFKRNIQV